MADCSSMEENKYMHIRVGKRVRAAVNSLDSVHDVHKVPSNLRTREQVVHVEEREQVLELVARQQLLPFRRLLLPRAEPP